MQIQRMCTNYYVADYEVRLGNRLFVSLLMISYRILFPRKFYELSRLE